MAVWNLRQSVAKSPFKPLDGGPVDTYPIKDYTETGMNDVEYLQDARH